MLFEKHPHGVVVKTNARQARRYAALLSPTREFEPTARRAHYILPAVDEVQALRDAEFLRGRGINVLYVR